jgi:hypothetical protein
VQASEASPLCFVDLVAMVEEVKLMGDGRYWVPQSHKARAASAVDLYVAFYVFSQLDNSIFMSV